MNISAYGDASSSSTMVAANFSCSSSDAYEGCGKDE